MEWKNSLVVLAQNGMLENQYRAPNVLLKLVLVLLTLLGMRLLAKIEPQPMRMYFTFGNVDQMLEYLMPEFNLY